MTNREEMAKHFEELIRLSKIMGIEGTGLNIGKYYVTFNFRVPKEICKECGKQK